MLTARVTMGSKSRVCSIRLTVSPFLSPLVVETAHRQANFCIEGTFGQAVWSRYEQNWN